MDMDCDDARLEISSAIDDGIAVSSAVEAHLDTCPSCRQWQEGIHKLRRATLRSVDPAPAPQVSVTTKPQRFALHRWVRFALAWAAVLLIVGSVVDMFSAGEGPAIHLERHQAAFDVALGLAFLFVAWRPDRAYGMVPFAATFTVALSVSAIIDLSSGVSTVSRESAHLIEIAGLALLWVLGVAVGPVRKRRRRDLGPG
jgi:predicted anti-sigma-YlaC factor YlaD